MQQLLYRTQSKENTKLQKRNKQKQASQLLCEAEHFYRWLIGKKMMKRTTSMSSSYIKIISSVQQH